MKTLSTQPGVLKGIAFFSGLGVLLYQPGCTAPDSACSKTQEGLGDTGYSRDEEGPRQPEVGSDSGEMADLSNPKLPGVHGKEYDAATLEPPFFHRNSVWAGVSLLDFDSDGWLDIFLPNGLGGADALYRNQGDGTFVDVAEEAGVASLAENGASVAGDLDNDGDMDLIVNTSCSTGTYNSAGLRVNDGDKILYHNNGDGTFTRQAIPVPGVGNHNGDPLIMCATSLTLVDWNQDGFLDLGIANHVDPDLLPPWIFAKRDGLAKNMIFLNDGNGSFNEILHEETVTDDYYVSFVLSFFDIDGNGTQDLLQAQGGQPVEVILNQSMDSMGPAAQDRSESGDGLWMGMAVADFDGDDDLDVYATNQGLSPYMVGYDNTTTTYWSSGIGLNIWHSMLVNDEGNFSPADWPVEAPQILAGDLFEAYFGGQEEWKNPTGLNRYAWGWGAVALDANADGWMDVAFTGNNSSPPMTIIWSEEQGAGPGALLLNMEGNGFHDVTWKWGIQNTDELGRYQDGRGIATGDLNNDGYADIVFANRSYNSSQSDPLSQVAGTPHVWLSHTREGNWLQIDPVGTQSNRDGIGSLIRVDNGVQPQLYVLGAGGETNSSSERLLTVGVGAAEEVDIEVLFPSGQTESVFNAAVNQRISIVESAQ